MTPRTGVTLTAAVLGMLLALTGCGGSGTDKPATSGGSAKVEKNADGSVVVKAPAGAATAKVDPGTGDVTVKTDDGEVTAGKGLPAGFPKAEVPVVDGAVVGGSKGDAGAPYAYTVLLQVDGSSPGAVVTTITKQLEGAGYRAVPGMTMDEMSTATFTGPKWSVGVNVIRGSGRLTVTYVVQRTKS